MNRIAAPSFVRFVYAMCMSRAAFNHITAIVGHGLFWDYGGLPVAICVFWTSLAFFDSLAVLLLFAKPRAGVALTALIIVADVAANTWALVTITLPLNPNLTIAQAWAYIAQVAFLLFVAVTARRAWGPPRPGTLDGLEYVQPFIPRGIGDGTRH